MATHVVLLICLSAFLPIPSSSQSTTELYYAGFTTQKANVSLDGAAMIDNSGVLRLTNETSRLRGHAFYPSPIKFKNSAGGKASSFSTCFAFSIHPQYPKLGGHGMAFAMAPSRDLNSSSQPSQYLGLFSANNTGNFSDHIFAVELDTVQDFEFGDINDNHVGIDINSLQSNASAAAAYFSGGDGSEKTDINIKSGKPIMVWIDYDSATNFINVTLSPSSSKPRTPLLSYQVDLSAILEEDMYVGFSASTGLLASSHYVLGWSFKTNGEAKSLDMATLPSVPGTKKKHTSLIVGLSASSLLLVLCSVVLAVFLVRKIKNAEVIESWELEIGPHRYKYHELKQATRRFKDSELLGVGGFGRVYKGTLANPKTEVAVKHISHESKQGVREFMSEISSIGRLRHRNLVQLLGWCRRGGDLLLVYDYMPNGSLDKWLFGDEPPRGDVLGWKQRFKIVKGVATGLLYLHEGYEQVVIHRDVKASNVLLDGEMNGRLGDFGLAKLYDHGSNPGTTRIVGTLGYLAPELSRTGRATTGSDVFAFGNLLLEVTCGRRPIEPKGGGPEDEGTVLADYVWSKWREGRVLDVADKRMKGDFDGDEVAMVLKLGLMCSGNDPSRRPSMRQVVGYLEGEIDMPGDRAVGEPGGAAVGERGFEDYLRSYASSSFDDNTTGSYAGPASNVDTTSFASASSPVRLLHGLGGAR